MVFHWHSLHSGIIESDIRYQKTHGLSGCFFVNPNSRILFRFRVSCSHSLSPIATLPPPGTYPRSPTFCRTWRVAPIPSPRRAVSKRTRFQSWPKPAWHWMRDARNSFRFVCNMMCHHYFFFSCVLLLGFPSRNATRYSLVYWVRCASFNTLIQTNR